MKYLALAAAALSLTGCSYFQTATSTVDMQAPSKAAYTLKASYDATLVVATQYARQPRCGAPGAPIAPLCSDRALLNNMLVWSDAANKATQGAEDAVRTFGNNPSLVRVAIEGAQRSVDVFRQVTETVTKKKVQ